mmetsp:Transcript_21831/g.21566  ORF Transcript_21831/g.21566 Transcript_21831/m.21566 type:complete len:102 (+) Transcript_21831:2-307(+)
METWTIDHQTNSDTQTQDQTSEMEGQTCFKQTIQEVIELISQINSSRAESKLDVSGTNPEVMVPKPDLVTSDIISTEENKFNKDLKLNNLNSDSEYSESTE